MSPLISVAAIVMFSSACLVAGCATSRGVVRLPVPKSENIATSNGIEISIQLVVDKRVFEEAPRSPNIPSLDPSEPQDAKIKLRSIARKRNSFGKGLGGILLEEGQTVESVIHDSLRQSFIESGYTVVENNASMSKGSQIVDVEINKFWSWMNTRLLGHHVEHRDRDGHPCQWKRHGQTDNLCKSDRSFPSGNGRKLAVSNERCADKLYC